MAQKTLVSLTGPKFRALIKKYTDLNQPLPEDGTREALRVTTALHAFAWAVDLGHDPDRIQNIILWGGEDGEPEKLEVLCQWNKTSSASIKFTQKSSGKICSSSKSERTSPEPSEKPKKKASSSTRRTRSNSWPPWVGNRPRRR